MLGRAFRLIWGDDVDRALRPLLIVGFVGSMAGSACWTFIGIWAIDELYFVVAAVVSAGMGYFGGHISDHLGRRPVILVGWSLAALVPLSWTLVDDFGTAIPLLLLVSLFAPIAMAATQALVADVVPAERHEHSYASLRVANNLGVTLGPPIGGALLITGSYDVLWIGVTLVGAVETFLAWRLLPSRGAYTPEEPPSRGSFGVIRRDRAFLVFLVSMVLANLVYFAFEIVLPISAVDSHGLSPAAWGFLVVINPALVTLFQLRLTRRVERFPAAPKLALAMLLMGWPFLLLSVNASIACNAASSESSGTRIFCGASSTARGCVSTAVSSSESMPASRSAAWISSASLTPSASATCTIAVIAAPPRVPRAGEALRP